MADDAELQIIIDVPAVRDEGVDIVFFCTAALIYVGGLPPTTPRRSKMGLLDAHALTPLSIPVVGSERRNATKTAPGLAL